MQEAYPLPRPFLPYTEASSHRGPPAHSAFPPVFLSHPEGGPPLHHLSKFSCFQAQHRCYSPGKTWGALSMGSLLLLLPDRDRPLVRCLSTSFPPSSVAAWALLPQSHAQHCAMHTVGARSEFLASNLLNLQSSPRVRKGFTYKLAHLQHRSEWARGHRLLLKEEKDVFRPFWMYFPCRTSFWPPSLASTPPTCSRVHVRSKSRLFQDNTLGLSNS